MDISIAKIKARGMFSRMFSRRSIGVSVSSTGVACARLVGPASAPILDRVSWRPLPSGVLRFSLREKNILNAALFHETVREARNSLLCPASRVYLTLPDSVGRILLMDVEERFRSRAEAIDILRWKLKKMIPFESSEVHLDYQCLTTRDNGTQAVMVALVARTVIEQYEDAFAAAGIIPVRVDLDCFNLHRLFENRLSAHGDFVLVSRFAASLGMMFFSGGIPEYIRLREMPAGHAPDATVHNEIKCTMLSYRERFRKDDARAVFCLAPPQWADGFIDIARDALRCEPALLETRTAVSAAKDVPSDQESLFPFTTAIGAALRGM